MVDNRNLDRIENRLRNIGVEEDDEFENYFDTPYAEVKKFRQNLAKIIFLTKDDKYLEKVVRKRKKIV
mgnify:CR=1 FL=1